MKLLENKFFVKSALIFIWVFFIARLNFVINIKQNIFEFDQKNWLNFMNDLLSIITLVFLVVYLIKFFLVNKKIPKSLILILFPMSGFIGYLNNYEFQGDNIYILHQFITLSSIILFFIVIDSNKLFDVRFCKYLCGIFIFFIIIFFIIKILPIITFKLLNNWDLRTTYLDYYLPQISLQKNIPDISSTQNINGQARILFILQLIFLVLQKKFIEKKIFFAEVCFFFSLLLLSVIIQMQSRFIILSSCVLTCYIILSNINLEFKKKILYLLLIFSTICITLTFGSYKRILQFEDEEYLSTKLSDRKLPDEKYFSAKLADRKLSDEADKYYLEYNRSLCTLALDKIDIISSGRLCGWEILIKNLKKKDLLFGKGFFADEKLMRKIQKKASNSWINILIHAGILSLIITLLFTIFFMSKFFKFRNMNNNDFYLSFSHYLLIFILCRSLLEDTLAFVNIDSLLLLISILVIRKNYAVKLSKK